MGTLADAYADAVFDRSAPRPCPVDKLLRSYDEDDRKVFQNMLDDENLNANTIGDIVRRAGGRIGHDTVNKHRKGMCSCGRTV